MGIDVSAQARVLGIETEFKNMREGATFSLPQRIAVIGQGATDSVYSLDKRQVTSATEVGARYGWGSPLHLVARQLFPANGGGVGTIPVTIYPLEDHDSGIAAAGSITPSGLQTKAAQYRAVINGMQSELFVIPVGASVSTVCGLVGAAINAVLEMPVVISYAYGTVTGTAGAGNTGDGTISALSAANGVVPGGYKLECIAAAADGGTFALRAPNGSLVSNSLVLTASTATPFVVGGLSFTVTPGAADFVVGDSFAIDVPATEVTLTSKWAGQSANAINVSIVGEDFGTTFAIVQPAGGIANPAVDAALALFGSTWETIVINALDIADTTALDAIEAVGEGRWGAEQHKPFVAFTGVVDADVNAATAVCAARRTDRVNAQLVAPGSPNLPFVVAARQAGLIARVANENPPTDYAKQRATGLIPGADSLQWSYAQRDQALKLGSSTIEVKDGIVAISDVVTFYRPEGDPTPAYRFVVDVMKVMNVAYNIALIFEADGWAGAPLIPNSQATVNPLARKPSSAKAAMATMFDSLGLNAIIADPDYAKKNTTASIDGQNHRRLNVEAAFKLSGNVGIIDVIQRFGFFYPAVSG